MSESIEQIKEDINADIIELTSLCDANWVIRLIRKYEISLVRTNDYGHKTPWVACSGCVELDEIEFPPNLATGEIPHIAIKNCLLKILKVKTNQCPDCAKP